MISFENVSKRYGAQIVLDAVGIQINPGDRVGVVGPNGAGKSTLIDMIAGEVAPDSGRVTIPRNSRIGYLRQQLDNADAGRDILSYAEDAVPDLRRVEEELDALEHAFAEGSVTDREAALERLGDLQTKFEQLGGYDLRHGAEIALSGLGFTADSMHLPLNSFSGGWQMRVELARALVANPDILLLDEPSNYLDLPAVEWLQRRLREFRGTLVLISHDRYLLNTLSTVTLEVANGFAERYRGNYDSYVEERRLRYEQRLSAKRNNDRKREKTEQFITRFRAKATKATQVKSKMKMLERMETVNVPQQIVSKGTIRIPTPARSGHEVIRLENVGVTYDQERWVLQDVNLHLTRGEKVALVGLNGMGKTTLLRIMTGHLAPSSGARVLGHKVDVGYQSQEFTDTMDLDRSVMETVKSVSMDASEQQVRSILGSFGFSGESVEKKISILSGGEKVRVAFARLLMNPPNFLLLDEPTTHLDIAAREALEEALRNYKGTLCVVSHDVEFVRHVAESIIAMDPPGIRRYPGDYDYYRQKVIEAEKLAAGTTTTPTVQADTGTVPGGAPQQSGKERRRERAEQRKQQSAKVSGLKKQIRQCERQIDIFEEEQAELIEQLNNADATLDFAALNQRLSLIQREIASYTARWEEAATELASAEEA